MRGIVRCWWCDTPFRSGFLRDGWRNPHACSVACSLRLHGALQRQAKTCLTCGKTMHPSKRADAQYCSAKCYQRAYRVASKERYFENLRDVTADARREIREARRRARRLDADYDYRDTGVGRQIWNEAQHIHATFEGGEARDCEKCGRRVVMRRGQRFCSTRCRVASHRGQTTIPQRWSRRRRPRRTA
jgi:endogenous inhibitor of DNA gyrase (YacG/DUF329 family)